MRVNTREEKQFFEEQGYLVVRGLLTNAELEACNEEIHRLHRLAVDLEESSGEDLDCFQREPFEADANQGDLPVLRKIEQTGKFSEVFKELAAHPALIRVIRALLGNDLLLFRSTLMLKPAFHGSAHGLHQDSAYWPMDPPTLVTVSIALSDATPENGCIQVIPKSHLWGMQEWGDIARDQDAELTERKDVDLSNQIEVPLEAGDALLFHSLLVHGSGPNRSANPRHTALYAYFPPTVHYVPAENAPREKTFRVVSGAGGRDEMTMVAGSHRKEPVGE
jgi:phytanoyl-CoA hydroxylase